MTTIYAIPDTVVARELGDELVLLDLKAGTYFGLDPVGAVIWQAIDGSATFDDLCSTALAEFEVEEAVLRRDVAELVETLEGKGLVIRQG